MTEANDKLDAAKALIDRYMSKWVQRLGLNWWKIVVRTYDDPGEIIQRFRHSDDGIVAAICTADWRYAEATIDINLPAWVDMTEDEVERAVVHELVHILVNEMREGELHHEERVVTGITKAMFWVEEAAREDTEAEGEKRVRELESQLADTARCLGEEVGEHILKAQDNVELRRRVEKSEALAKKYHDMLESAALDLALRVDYGDYKDDPGLRTLLRRIRESMGVDGEIKA